MLKTVKCPICEKKVKFDAKKDLPANFPFCSKRCKLVDLGKWLNEEYTANNLIYEEDLPDDDKK
ncbi:MAG: DNA gyrase inhibitor YacG [Candidatus Poribacteria bacterium]